VELMFGKMYPNTVLHLFPISFVLFLFPLSPYQLYTMCLNYKKYLHNTSVESKMMSPCLQNCTHLSLQNMWYIILYSKKDFEDAVKNLEMGGTGGPCL
jgi:hypothetical protein